MFTKPDIMRMWKEVSDDIKVRFPHYAKLLKDNGWKMTTSNQMNSAFGWAAPADKIVTINLHLHKHSPRENVLDTMYHECAHAIDFCLRGRSDHGVHWKKIARELGCTDKRKSKTAIKVEYKYVLIYKDGNEYQWVMGFNRRPARKKPNQVDVGTYLKGRPETEGKIWLYSWEMWCSICKSLGKEPYRENWK